MEKPILPVRLEMPDDFFKEDIGSCCQFDTMLKKLWAVELDLLNEFIKVCETNNLRYFVTFGTLLGTIRHKGFIPWDDDVDVIMPRDDFDKLLQIGNTVFKFPYFFQTPLSEKKPFFRTHPQLRNSLTTGAIASDVKKDINRGIFMDIFVLDEVALEEVNDHRKRLGKYRNIGLTISSPLNLHCPFAKKVKRIIKYLLYRMMYNQQQVFRLFHKEAAKFAGKGYGLLAHTTLLYQDAAIWDKADWDGYILMPFENLKVRVPVGYHNILTKHYGNYMTPHKTAGNLHGEISLNPEVPYDKLLCN
ncbi:MAG: LicD family protein [Paludibacteraceae bacterium]|nr:LicD family protein [Paludibacteraceae bacterium]